MLTVISFISVAHAQTCTAPVNGTTADATQLNTYLNCEFAPLASPSFTGSVFINRSLSVGDGATSTTNDTIYATDASSTGQASVGSENDTSGANLSLVMFGSAATSTSFGIGRAGMAALETGSANTGPMGIGTRHNANLYLGTNDIARMTFDTAGNVGIGTTSPSAPLHVLQDTNGGTISLVSNSSTGTSAFSDFEARNVVGTTGTAVRLGVLGTNWTTSGEFVQNGGFLDARSSLTGGLSIGADASTGVIRFYTGGNEAMRIDDAGNVGIGTTAPTNPLTVVGSLVVGDMASPTGTAAGRIYATESLNTGAGAMGSGNDASESINLDMYGSAATSTIFGQAKAHLAAVQTDPSNTGAMVVGTRNNAALYLGTDGATRMQIAAAGNVTINTPTGTTQALEVNGKLQVDMYASAASTAVCVNANVLSSCSSSIRYKENVQDAVFGLKEVLQMRPVTFKWKGRDENDLGLIAEEIAKINPLFVTYKDGKVEGVKYAQLTAVLVNAVKELKASNDALEAENRQLKAASDRQAPQLEQLEAVSNRQTSLIARMQTQLSELVRKSDTKAAATEHPRTRTAFLANRQ